MKRFVIMLAAMVFWANGAVVSAQQEVPVKLSATEVEVNQETGEFQFDIVTGAGDAYAGMEFGMACGPECEIVSVEYDREISATGPVKSDMTWFGFFDGEDSFTESVTITVLGKCQIGVDSELALKTVKKYIIGDKKYREEEYQVDTRVKLSAVMSDTQEECFPPVEIQTENEEVSISWITVLCILGVAGIAGVLIYKFWP